MYQVEDGGGRDGHRGRHGQECGLQGWTEGAWRGGEGSVEEGVGKEGGKGNRIHIEGAWRGEGTWERSRAGESRGGEERSKANDGIRERMGEGEGPNGEGVGEEWANGRAAEWERGRLRSTRNLAVGRAEEGT